MMMKNTWFLVKSFVILQVCILVAHPVAGQFVSVGSGSYRTTFPGVDAAARNSFPSGAPQLSGDAVGKPVPTNDWWSLLIKNDHASNIFNYPLALQTSNAGLIVSYIPSGVYGDQVPIVAGVTSLNASKATVSDYSDWTVTMDWSDGTHHFGVTSGIGMPFLYFTKATSDVAQMKVNSGTVTITDEMLLISNAASNADFVVYAPAGSTWEKSGSTYTSTLNGKDYWSMAMLPLTTSNIPASALAYKKYAYVFPINTSTAWDFNENTSVVRTDFIVETEVKEGIDTLMLLGLLPHQWANLASDSSQPDKESYKSIRGELKTMAGNRFSVENTFHGILPTLPYVSNYSEGFSLSKMNDKVQQLENDGLSSWTDSYNEGQMMNRLIQTARIADIMGNTSARDKMLATIKERLEDWLKAEAGEVAFLFYYNTTWSTLIGYPAGHGQDNNINDHHFHWGYFIHAASFVEQIEPGWAAQWGEMVNELVRDAASSKRDDTKYPFLRNFSPYAGHCWANGFATFPQGNDQESTSESMQFNSSLIHWGTITGNDEIRDLGIYLYTTEQTAINEYWLDVSERNFSDLQQYSLVSRVWGNSYDNGTFWTADIAASYGIELYPIHGGSLYLGHDLAYAQKLWDEIAENTGILTNQANDNLWHDVMWEFLAFTNPAKAIELYDSYPDRGLKFGVSDAQTYYWLHSMNALGNVDASITADYPLAVAFKKGEVLTYTAHNYGSAPLSVTFSDGYSLQVPPNKMVTSKDVAISASLSSSFEQAYTNGSVDLTVTVENGAATKVEFFDGETMVGELAEAPFILEVSNLSAGKHSFYAKVYLDDAFGVSNIANVIVGQQLPYDGTALPIPGIIEAGKYDRFEGGSGLGISYNDVSSSNEGSYRMNESADAAIVGNEGATIGWISSGEWLEYTIDVNESGMHAFAFRYASDNSSGGGPFHLELDDHVISDDIFVNSTNGWDKWATKTITNIPLTKGQHILKVAFDNGEFNLGKMTFTQTSALGYNQPVANAGQNVIVLAPQTTADLDGTACENPGSEPLNYLWSQMYGPSKVSFSDKTTVNPQLSNLKAGVYAITLTVSNGSYSDMDEVLVIVSNEANIAPIISINSPENNTESIAGKDLSIVGEAYDLDGSIAKVDFYDGDELMASSTSEPYAIVWSSTTVGTHSITAVATDNLGRTSRSNPTTITLTAPPPCKALASNGDFSFEFSDDANNPTITFLPSKNGVGSPTCIFYYSKTASGPFPGYMVTPNVPFKLNASEGTTVYFYYTYSYPGAGERNTSGNLATYVVGSCSSVTSIKWNNRSDQSVYYYPNPVREQVTMKLPLAEGVIRIYDMRGVLLERTTVKEKRIVVDMSTYAQGMYFFEVLNSQGVQSFKILKQNN